MPHSLLLRFALPLVLWIRCGRKWAHSLPLQMALCSWPFIGSVARIFSSRASGCCDPKRGGPRTHGGCRHSVTRCLHTSAVCTRAPPAHERSLHASAVCTRAPSAHERQRHSLTSAHDVCTRAPSKGQTTSSVTPISFVLKEHAATQVSVPRPPFPWGGLFPFCGPVLSAVSFPKGGVLTVCNRPCPGCTPTSPRQCFSCLVRFAEERFFDEVRHNHRVRPSRNSIDRSSLWGTLGIKLRGAFVNKL